MKKILAYTLAFLSTFLVSCQKDNVLVQQEQNGKVTVSLDFVTPEPVAMTKAFGETADLEDNGLWVAVYESGYRCEVVQAENLTESPAGSGKYTCKLTLSVTENKRNLHFISMEGFTAADAPYEETRLGSLTSEGGVDAYWQIRTLNNIPYDVPTLKSALEGSTGSITLIRNFAKVTMSVSSTVTNFEMTSFKVFNTPNKGYLAPYVPNYVPTGDPAKSEYESHFTSNFISDYDGLEYKGTTTPLKSGALDVYPGRMPNGCTLNGYDDTYIGGANFIAAGQSDYFYERPVPVETPAFIIVKGKFGANETARASAPYTYYKINLRDKDDEYYALLRGFRFKVNILEVIAEGYSTVLEAYNSAGSGDISTSLEYSSISNISDGVCRLFVNATSFTAIKAGTIEVKYKFIPDVENASTTVKNTVLNNFDATTNTGVSITVKNPADGIQPSIAKNSSDEWDYTVGTTDDADGWRTITVKTNAPNNLYKEQVINIRGRGNDGTNTTVLQRDVHIIVRPTLTLYAEMAEGYSSIGFGKDKNVKLNFWMEDELPESIFPLNVKVEAGKLTLTPAPGEQLPVESGQSASTSDPKPAFYFVKTVTWSDYTGAPTETKSVGGVTRKMRKFVCNFKTNTAESATSIYVSHELFNTASTSFTNATALSLSPVSPGTWSATASEEPYAGQTFNVTIVASVPAGTTITGTTTVGGSSSNVTASISGTILTITRTGMSYSTSGIKDLAVATTLSTGSFSFTPKVVVWSKPSITKTTGITVVSDLASNDYIVIGQGNYYIYDNGSTSGNSVKLSTLPSPITESYVWQVKDLSGSNLKLMNYGTGKYVETRPNGTTGQTTNTTSTSSNYATLTISYISSNWQFKLSSQSLYFNNWSGSNSNIGWYNDGAGSDSGSRFQIYKCTVTPAERPTE